MFLTQSLRSLAMPFSVPLNSNISVRPDHMYRWSDPLKLILLRPGLSDDDREAATQVMH